MNRYLLLATDHGVIRSSQKEGKWQVIDKQLTDRSATCITANDSGIILGSRNGIYLSNNLGQSWAAAKSGLNENHVRWLYSQAENPQQVLAGFEPAAIYVSNDGGQSWQGRPEVEELRDHFNWMLPYSPESGCVRGFYSHGTRVYAAVEVGGLLRSNDSGSSWSLVPASSGIPSFGFVKEDNIHPDVHSVAGHPDSEDLIFAPTGGGFFVSEDGGQTFRRRYPPCYCRAVWVDPADRDHLILGPAEGVDRDGQVMETEDGGDSWTAVNDGLAAPWSRTMVERFYSHDGGLLALLSDGRLFTSDIGKWQWQQILTEVSNIRALTFTVSSNS